MGIADFLMGKPETVENDPRSIAARNFILDELNRVYGQGPINVPRYFAEVPETQFSGANNLLSALGLDTVATPDIDTVDVGGISAYSSEPLQAQIEADFAEKYPSLYNQLIEKVNAQQQAALTASLQPMYSGGGSSSDNAGAPRYRTAQAFDRFGATDMVDKYANPSYNAEIAIANANKPVTFVNSSGQTQTKRAKDITSDDARGAIVMNNLGNPLNSNASANAMGAATMLASGIRNVGGGYSQPPSSFGQDLKNMANKIGSDIKNKTLIGRIFGGGR